MSDGMASLHFVNTWCDIARGSGVSLLPFIDRSSLRARDPPAPSFSHAEFSPPSPLPGDDVSYCRLGLDGEKLEALKAKVAQNPSAKPYSTFVSLAAHIWKCCCAARNLLDSQSTRVFIPVDGRERLHPPLPAGYFGNVRFIATSTAVSGEITSKPLWCTAAKIHDGINRMDDQYLRSQLDYLELKTDVVPPGYAFRCPNANITSWRLPIYDADFGWGRPVFMGPLMHLTDGESFIMRNPTEDGSVLICVGLYAAHMERFRKLFYEI